MSRGLPTSGTIKLTDIMKAFNRNESNVISTSTYTSGSGTSVAAPTGACACLIQIYGGGGGGRGYSIGIEYGGGGGAYNSIKLPVVAGVTTFDYVVGAGGAGGSSANGSAGGASTVTVSGATLVAGGGGGGKTPVAGTGGVIDADLSSTLDGFTAAGADGTTGAGGNDGSGAASGAVGTAGQAGTAPGGGGAPHTTSGGTGGAGGAGRVVITWYGPQYSSGTNLRAFLAGGTYVKAGAAGYNSRNIPASGTLNLKDFYGAEEVGMHSNTTITISHTDTTQSGTATANASLRANASSGALTVSGASGYQRYMRRLLGNDDTNVTQHFDILFNRTSASGSDTTLYGDTANTWTQASTTKWWSCMATRSTTGTNVSSMSGYFAIRRRSDNVVVANVLCNFTATADRQPAPDGK